MLAGHAGSEPAALARSQEPQTTHLNQKGKPQFQNSPALLWPQGPSSEPVSSEMLRAPRQPEAAKILLEAKADPLAQDNNGLKLFRFQSLGAWT